MSKDDFSPLACQRLRLNELIEFSRDGEWGYGTPGDDLIEMAVIRGTDFSSVRRGDVSSLPRRFIPKKIADRKMLMPGDVLIETAGGTQDQPTGRTVFISEDILYSLPVPVICASFSRFLRLDRRIVDPRYLFWYFQSIYATDEMLPYHIQHTGVARFQYTDFASQCMVPIPSLLEQKVVADILSSFDNKIENNRRTNETLEAMARAIFKDWFVDFGPVRAKAEGRAPYLAPEIWSLFPDTLDDEDKPEGWGEKRIDDVLELAYGKALPASERVHGPVPVYGSGGITGYHNVSLVDGPSIIVGRKGTVGSLYWEDRPFYPIDTVFYVVPKIELTYCFYLLETFGLHEMNTDAAVPGLNRNNVYRLTFPWASDDLMHAFGSLVGPIRQMISANNEESKNLSETRDFLLPKLMSGEIRVKDAEHLIQQAV